MAQDPGVARDHDPPLPHHVLNHFGRYVVAGLYLVCAQLLVELDNHREFCPGCRCWRRSSLRWHAGRKQRDDDGRKQMHVHTLPPRTRIYFTPVALLQEKKQPFAKKGCSEESRFRSQLELELRFQLNQSW